LKEGKARESGVGEFLQSWEDQLFYYTTKERRDLAGKKKGRHRGGEGIERKATTEIKKSTLRCLSNMQVKDLR